MPSIVVAQPAATSNRFFAITADRLDAIGKYRLTRADIQVWALVELAARPRLPIAFTLEAMAEQLHLGVATVRRSVRRLLDARLLVGIFEGNRYRLAPAAGAFDQAGENLPPMIGCLPKQAGSTKATNRSRMVGKALENLPNRINEDASNQATGLNSVDPPENLSSEISNKLDLCPLGTALVSDWGMYPAVAARMVTTYGENRVRQVMLWGEHLKATGKLKSRGWCFQALTRGWLVPDTFNEARQEAHKGPRNTRRVVLDHSDEEKARMVRWHLSRTDEAMRVEGRRLAVLWGVSLV